MGILKKIKKGLKKVAKPALGIGAALLAAKALKGRGTDTGLTDGKFLASGAAGGASLAKQDRMAKAIKAMTSNDAYSDDTKPSNLGTMRSTPRKRNMYSPGDGLDSYMAKGGRAGKKSKPKSMGKALRGGGKVMR
jgi:hypothetical protein